MDIVMKTNATTGRQWGQEADFDESRRVVRVVPKNEQIRKYLKHPRTRVGFLAEGSAEWPNDAFTKRRVADGDVSIEQPAQIEQQPLQAAPQQAAPRQAVPPAEPVKT